MNCNTNCLPPPHGSKALPADNRDVGIWSAQALVVAALAICRRGELHIAVMLLSDAQIVFAEGDDCEIPE